NMQGLFTRGEGFLVATEIGKADAKVIETPSEFWQAGFGPRLSNMAINIHCLLAHFPCFGAAANVSKPCTKVVDSSREIDNEGVRVSRSQFAIYFDRLA